MSSRTETPSAQPVADPPRTTRLSTLLLLVGWACVVLSLLYLLELRPSLRTKAPAVDAVPTLEAGFPSPPRGAVVYSRRMGDDALALGILPAAARSIVQASVVGPQGEGVSGLAVAFVVQGQTISARSCGDGCYRAAVAIDGRPRSVDVVVDGASTTRWSVVLPRQWPPRSAASLVARAERVWRSLSSLSFDETLGSGSGRVVTSSWRVQAPDRLAYRIVGGPSAIVIGKRRWDKSPGKPWKASSQSPIRQPVPTWVRPTDARIVGATVVRGRPALVVTFFDASTPGWFRLVVDRATLRTLDVRMVATAHFMHDRFHSFDETPAIRPPGQE